MFNVHFAGHLTRPIVAVADRKWIASICGFDGKAARLIIRRERLAKQLAGLEKGEPVSGTGGLNIQPVINSKGEPHAFLSISVGSLATLEAGEE